MGLRIEGRVCGTLDIKRCYLKGMLIWDVCPKCGLEIDFNGNYEYLSFPSIGRGANMVPFICGSCNITWEKYVKLTLSVEESESSSESVDDSLSVEYSS